MRNDLSRFPLDGASHAGHALAYLLPPKKKGEEEATNQALQELVRIHSPQAEYAAAYARWQQATAELGAASFQATTRGPLAIGLGNASLYEVGLTLHRTYGVPYLPGSALKGVALRAAMQAGVSEEDQRVLFGDQQSAGYVTFFDGWLHPKQAAPLQLDTITVHHPSYYGGGKQWPTDFDDPNPVGFLSVRPGLVFQVCVGGPGDWAELAAQLLDHGLTHLGLGGKTNAGYGGFTCTAPQRPLSAEEQAAHAARQQTAGAEKLAAHIRNELKNVRAFRESGNRLLAQVAELSQDLRAAPVQAFQEQAKKFSEKEWAKKAGKLLERE